jgi:hypothetical protein
MINGNSTKYIYLFPSPTLTPIFVINYPQQIIHFFCSIDNELPLRLSTGKGIQRMAGGSVDDNYLAVYANFTLE